MVVYLHRSFKDRRIVQVGVAKNRNRTMRESDKTQEWKRVARKEGIVEEILLETKEKKEATALIKSIRDLVLQKENRNILV